MAVFDQRNKKLFNLVSRKDEYMASRFVGILDRGLTQNDNSN